MLQDDTNLELVVKAEIAEIQGQVFDALVPHHVYILKLADSRLYAGSTSDLKTRIKDRRRWAGGAFTRVPGKKELVCSEELPGKSAALRRERQLKGWSRSKKMALVRGDRVKLHKLAASRARPARHGQVTSPMDR